MMQVMCPLNRADPCVQMAVVGANGAGKSSLLKLIAGVHPLAWSTAKPVPLYAIHAKVS